MENVEVDNYGNPENGGFSDGGQEPESGENDAKYEAKRRAIKQTVLDARERHQEALNVVYSALSRINLRLFDLQELIANSQFKQHGSLTLSLYECGPKCNGCPHYQWYKWVSKERFSSAANQGGKNVRKESPRKFFAVKAEYPLKMIAQSRVAKDHTAAMLVAEAKNLLDRKARILMNLKNAVRDSAKDI